MKPSVSRQNLFSANNLDGIREINTISIVFLNKSNIIIFLLMQNLTLK